MFGRASARAAHWLFYASGFSFETGVLNFDDPTAGKGEQAGSVELRVGGNERGVQTVFPASTHEGGEDIRWEAEAPRRAGSHGRRRSRGDGCAGSRPPPWRHATGRQKASGTRRHWPSAAHLRRAGWGRRRSSCSSTRSVAAAGDPEHKDRVRAAADSAEAVDADKRAYGLPKLAEMLGDKVVDCRRQVAGAAERCLVRTCPGARPG